MKNKNILLVWNDSEGVEQKQKVKPLKLGIVNKAEYLHFELEGDERMIRLDYIRSAVIEE